MTLIALSDCFSGISGKKKIKNNYIISNDTRSSKIIVIETLGSQLRTDHYPKISITTMQTSQKALRKNLISKQRLHDRKDSILHLNPFQLKAGNEYIIRIQPQHLFCTQSSSGTHLRIGHKKIIMKGDMLVTLTERTDAEKPDDIDIKSEPIHCTNR